jgi:hypothetical protein
MYNRNRVFAATNHGDDHAGLGVRTADVSVGAAVENEEVAGGVHREAQGIGEDCVSGGAAIAGVAGGVEAASDGPNDAIGRIHLADEEILRVSGVQTPRRVDGEAKWGREWPAGRAAIAGVVGPAIAGIGGYGGGGGGGGENGGQQECGAQDGFEFAFHRCLPVSFGCHREMRGSIHGLVRR